MSAGGKREGAGRKPLPPEDQPEALTIKAHPSAIDRFNAWREAKRLSQREAFEKLVRRLPPSPARPEHVED